MNPLNSPQFSTMTGRSLYDQLLSAIQKAESTIDKVVLNQQAPTFENTSKALEVATVEVDEVSSVFFSLLSAHATEDFVKISKDFQRDLTLFYDRLYLNSELFSRLENLSNSGCKERLCELQLKSFIKHGANLDDAQKKRLTEINLKLSSLSLDFDENLKKEVRAKKLIIKKSDKDKLKGLSESFIENLYDEESESYVFGLDFPTYVETMSYLEDESIRKDYYLLMNQKCMEINGPLIKETLTLRQEKAKLLGFSDFIHMALDDRMLKDKQDVELFLNRLYKASISKAELEINEMKELKGKDDFYAYDSMFYSRLLKEKNLNINENEIRQYFPLRNCLEAAFTLAHKLFGLKFSKREDVEVYHPEVEVYEVRDVQNDLRGLLYTDFHPRPEKSSGAWMTSFRDHGLGAVEIEKPLISIVCNFTRPTKEKPSLLTFNEVLTLFHEFGHALHGLMSKVPYRSYSGTNVALDFVELPSQLLENWVYEEDFLSLFAHHYESGMSLSGEKIRRLKSLLYFQVASAQLRQLSFASLDMKIHDAQLDIENLDLIEFEKEHMRNYQFFSPMKEKTSMLMGFSHLFAGGYSAGYYSYKWSEVLEADVFEEFKKSGLFNQEVGKRFLDQILSQGSSKDEIKLFENFLGRKPNPQSLLARQGLDMPE